MPNNAIGRATERSSSGVWNLRAKRNEDGRATTRPWMAWAHFFYFSLGKTFLPDVMTVPDEWPPVNVHGASRVADGINAIRADKEVNWGKRVPDHPEPWDGSSYYDPREPHGTDRLISPDEVHDVINRVRRSYPRVFGRHVIGEFEQPKTPLEYKESPPELIAKAKALVSRAALVPRPAIGPE